MKGIVLSDFEIRRLSSAGSVLIWRRVKPQPAVPTGGFLRRYGKGDGHDEEMFLALNYIDGHYHPWDGVQYKCPLGSTGETCFVKETWRSLDEEQRIIYKADYQPIEMKMRWKSSVSMPSEASRFRVTLSVSCRQIQSVTEEEAIACGCDEAHLEHTEDCKSEYCALAGGVGDCCGYLISSRLHLKSLIESRNPGSWERQDWFWAIEAKEVK